MGKSSLFSRWRNTLEGEGLRTAYVDLAWPGTAVESVEAWLRALAEAIAGALGGCESGQDFLLQPGNRGAVAARLAHLLKALASQGDSERLLVVLDEVDWIVQLPFAREILSALRGCQAELARQARGPAVGVCLIGLRAVHELGSPLHGTGSPLGQGFVMDDFTTDPETVEALSSVLSESPERSLGVAERILFHTGGQPYMTMVMADRVRRAGADSMEAVDQVADLYLESQRSQPRDLFSHIEMFLLEQRADAFAALSTYLDLLEGKRDPAAREAPGTRLLLLSGLMRFRGGRLDVKGALFGKFFDAEWARRAISRLALQETERRVQPAIWVPASRKRLCVFNTGGTIGMVRRGHEVRPPEDQEEFLRNYAHIEEIAEIDFQQLFNLDSVNVSPLEWVHIAKAIYERRTWGYSGFVVAHGTDTLAYTASAVAFALGPHLSFPVVFTGSQTTADVRHGDAHANMLRACLVALQPIHEVVICFGNHVFRGCRAQKRDERSFDGFESPTYPPLADIKETVEVYRSRLRSFPSPLEDIELRAEFASDILMVQLTPGLGPEFYWHALRALTEDGHRRCQGLVLQTLGAGNVVSLEPYSFLDFIDEAVRSGIPVLVTSPYAWEPGSDKQFSPAKAPLELGAISSGPMTAAAAVTKFRWALAQAKQNLVVGGTVRSTADLISEVSFIMERDLVGELVMPRDMNADQEGGRDDSGGRQF
jgi:L-asparaginase